MNISILAATLRYISLCRERERVERVAETRKENESVRARQTWRGFITEPVSGGGRVREVSLGPLELNRATTARTIPVLSLRATELKVEPDDLSSPDSQSETELPPRYFCPGRPGLNE